MSEVAWSDRARSVHGEFVEWLKQPSCSPGGRRAARAAWDLADMLPHLLTEIDGLSGQVLRVEQLISDPLFLHDRHPEDTITVAQVRAALDGKRPNHG